MTDDTDTTPRIINAGAIAALRALPEGSVQCMVSSYPYWSLRDYGVCGCALRRNVSPSLAESGGNVTDGSAGQLSTGDARCRRQPDPACPDCGGSGRIAMDTVWDEPPDPCEHQWATTYRYWDNPHASVLAADGRDDLGSHADARGKVPSITCARCGAWRGAFGLEPTVELYVQHAVQVGRELRRVLRADGTLWLNLGDSYAGSGKGPEGNLRAGQQQEASAAGLGRSLPRGLKPKDLVGVPWRVAFAYQADGWYFRCDNVWAKPNPMPESATDRPARAHEYIFLFAKSGTQQFWTHRDLPGTRKRPQPDYRYVDRLTDTEYTERPPNYAKGHVECPDCGGSGALDDFPPTCPSCEGTGRVRRWRRLNLWVGHDYFYDPDAVRVGLAPSTVQRAQSHYPNAADNPDTASKHGPGDRRAYPVVTAAMRDAASLARATGLARSTAQEVLDGYGGHATKSFAGTGAQDASAVKRRIIEGKRRRLGRAGYIHLSDAGPGGVPRSGFRSAQPRGGESSVVASKALKEGAGTNCPGSPTRSARTSRPCGGFRPNHTPPRTSPPSPRNWCRAACWRAARRPGAARSAAPRGPGRSRRWAVRSDRTGTRTKHLSAAEFRGCRSTRRTELTDASTGASAPPASTRMRRAYRASCWTPSSARAPRVPWPAASSAAPSGIELNPVYVRLARERVGRYRDLSAWAEAPVAQCLKPAPTVTDSESTTGLPDGGASVQPGPPSDPRPQLSL